MLAAATLWLGARMQTDDQWVRHTLAVENQIARVLNLVQRVETSQRGYLLTGQAIYLSPYKDAEMALEPAIDKTAKLVASNPLQRKRVPRLRGLVTERLNELRTTIGEHAAGRADTAQASVNFQRGMQTMERIRQLLSEMQSEEDRLLTIRKSTSSTVNILLQIGAATAFLAICVVGFLISVHTRQSFAQLTAVNDRLAATNEQLIEQMREREQTESQLRQMQKMKAIGELTGGIAHDFNNMLGVIAGSIDLVSRRIKKGDFDIERFVEAANQATRRAASLTRRLLAFARRQPLALKVVDVNKMIVDMSDLLRSTLGEDISIKPVAAAGLWSINADLHQLENAVLNIAINARDAMPEGGRLTIETGNTYLDDTYCRQHADVEPGQFVMIAITDTGSGMPPDVIAQAFDPFFTTKPVGAGTGLGLSQVYGFIRQSGGHIEICSELGAGTTVKIYLPRSISNVTENPAKAAALPQARTPDETILVVEDESSMRRLATDALYDLGYTVLESENARNALAILDNRPDVRLLFTDVVMPEISGKELAEEATRRRNDLKILFTTGYAPNAGAHGGKLDHNIQVLSKPFTLEQLATKVRAVLDA